MSGVMETGQTRPLEVCQRIFVLSDLMIKTFGYLKSSKNTQ